MWGSVASGQNPPTTSVVPSIPALQGLTQVWSASLSSVLSEYPNTALRPSFFWRRLNSIFVFCEGASCNYDIISFQGVVTEASPQSVPPSSQDGSGQQQALGVDNTSDHAPTYSFQPAKWVWETLHFDKMNRRQSILFPYAWIIKHTFLHISQQNLNDQK